MPYFEGIDKFGFPEDPYMGDSSTNIGSMLPDSIGTTEGGWLMGGPNTGLDDAAGWALALAGGASISPGLSWVTGAAIAGRLGAGAMAGPVGIAGAIALGVGMVAAGRALQGLD